MSTTLETTLPATALKTWQDSGYVFLKQFYNQKTQADIKKWVEDLTSWPETPGMWMRYYETNQNQKLLCRIENFVPYHHALADLLQHEKIMAILHELLGEPATLFKEKINFKLPGGKGFTPHQDAPAFASFGQTFHITLMIPIEKTDEENGCLYIAEHLNKEMLKQAEDGTIHPDVYQTFNWQPLECQLGDIVLFDSYMPHYSKDNLSSRSRRTIYATYNALSAGNKRIEYYTEKRKCFPPECERDPNIDYSKIKSVFNLGNPIK